MSEQSMVEKLLSNISPEPNTGCWLWLGAANEARGAGYYGTTYDPTARKQRRVHRIAYEQFIGPIPPDLVVRHKCDVGLCCNPAHLEVGTQKDNVADRYLRGRARHVNGERHGNARLTASCVLEIRRRRAAGETMPALAKAFGVSRYGIYHAVKGWKHLDAGAQK